MVHFKLTRREIACSYCNLFPSACSGWAGCLYPRMLTTGPIVWGRCATNVGTMPPSVCFSLACRNSQRDDHTRCRGTVTYVQPSTGSRGYTIDLIIVFILLKTNLRQGNFRFRLRNIVFSRQSWRRLSLFPSQKKTKWSSYAYLLSIHAKDCICAEEAEKVNLMWQLGWLEIALSIICGATSRARAGLPRTAAYPSLRKSRTSAGWRALQEQDICNKFYGSRGKRW
jgi:hypothetical protein